MEDTIFSTAQESVSVIGRDVEAAAAARVAAAHCDQYQLRARSVSTFALPSGR